MDKKKNGLIETLNNCANACADGCKEHSQMEHCRKCAEVCKHCADECSAMI